jgi:phosphoglycolate phosphatase-like HAD superfamily hydrolase
MHLILFDIDGTLTRTEEVDNRCYVGALSEVLGSTDVDTDWTKYRDVTDSGIASALWEACHGAPPSRQQLDDVCERFVALLEEELARDPAVCRAVPGAAAILVELAHRTGFAVGLATGGWRESARLKLRHAGLGDGRFPLASASDACSREVIMALAAERVAARRGISGFTSITYIGDGEWDVRAAKRLGWHFVGIGEGERAECLRGEGARWVIADYRNHGVFFEAIVKHGQAIPEAASSCHACDHSGRDYP